MHSLFFLFSFYFHVSERRVSSVRHISSLSSLQVLVPPPTLWTAASEPSPCQTAAAEQRDGACPRRGPAPSTTTPAPRGGPADGPAPWTGSCRPRRSATRLTNNWFPPSSTAPCWRDEAQPASSGKVTGFTHWFQISYYWSCRINDENVFDFSVCRQRGSWSQRVLPSLQDLDLPQPEDSGGPCRGLPGRGGGRGGGGVLQLTIQRGISEIYLFQMNQVYFVAFMLLSAAKVKINWKVGKSDYFDQSKVCLCCRRNICPLRSEQIQTVLLGSDWKLTEKTF